MPKSKIVKYAVFSDNHVNGRNPVMETLGQLTHLINDNPRAKEWDLIFWSGDFFDRCASFVDNDIVEIIYWVRNFLRWARDNKVAVRVLRGTPSHDWNQSELFALLADQFTGLDFKYHRVLESDYVEVLDCHVLYVPDEWGEGPSTTWQEVKALMKEKKIKKFGYAIMHGFFDFQIPSNLPPGVTFTHHKSKDYLSIVERMIYIGHDHTHKQYRTIIVPGSTNRNKHGEEEPKGYIEGEKTGKKDITAFIENKRAHIYITIDCRGLSQEEGFALVRQRVESLPERSSIRLEVNSDDEMSMSIPALQQQFPTLRFDPPKRHNIIKRDNKRVEVKDIERIEVTELNPDNFLSIVTPLLQHTDPEIIKRLGEIHDI